MSFGRRLRTLLLSMPQRIEYDLHERLLNEGWVAVAEDRCTWDVIVRQFCDIEKAPTPKDERLLEHVAGRQYAVTFRDSEQHQN